MHTVIILEQYLSDLLYSVSSASVSAAVDESRLDIMVRYHCCEISLVNPCDVSEGLKVWCEEFSDI